MQTNRLCRTILWPWSPHLDGYGYDQLLEDLLRQHSRLQRVSGNGQDFHSSHVSPHLCHSKDAMGNAYWPDHHLRVGNFPG